MPVVIYGNAPACRTRHKAGVIVLLAVADLAVAYQFESVAHRQKWSMGHGPVVSLAAADATCATVILF